jgi:universal stress protein A
MKIAELNDVNVILVGTGRQSDIPGITTEKLMHKSVKPVWAVPDKKSISNNILCPVDFSETSERALQNAIHLSRQFDAELTVLHVIEDTVPGYLRKSKLPPEKLKETEKTRKQEFDTYLEKFDFTKIRWKKKIVTGDAGAQIIAQADAQNAGLLLMGSVGQTGHPKMLTGNTARTVFRHPPAALISFKSENIVQLKLDNELRDLHNRFQQGTELMENGFVREAIAHFNYCLNEDPLFAPAWELLADAHYRLNEKDKALECKSKASQIREKLWHQSVEADIKNRHALYKPRKKESV